MNCINLYGPVGRHSNPLQVRVSNGSKPGRKKGRNVDLLELLRADGITLRKVASTHGGEWAGPCPLCREGNDRLRVWPVKGGGRWWCRICGKSGDSIQYLIDVRGLSYPEACNAIGIEIRKRGALTRSRSSEKPVFVPKETQMPSLQWQEKAAAFLASTGRVLRTDTGRVARRFLHGRGLADETIEGARLGWNPEDVYEAREAWDLPPARRDDGRMKRLWLPAGLVIPAMDQDLVVRLRIRRKDPGDGARYILVPGSVVAPMRFIQDHEAVVIVESELDGLLLYQEAGDLIDVMAMGSVSARPDAAAHEALIRADLILIALDSDKAGAKAAWGWWPETYGAKIRRWPIAIGMDI